MALMTTQKIAAYYEKYRSIDVTFTKEIIQVAGLVTQQVLLKTGGDFWPCIIYTSSMEGAKVVANVKSGILGKLQQANNSASLRFCFKQSDGDSPITFFVSVRITSTAPYDQSKDMNLFSLQFTQRPPDDLIEVLGRLLDANYNSVKRKNDRIVLVPEAVRRLKVQVNDCAVFIQGVPRRCILRELSFGGARLMLIGVAKFIVDKESSIRVDFDDPRENFTVKGKVSVSDAVEGRQDILAVGIEFTENTIPLGYKVRINDYLSQYPAATEKSGAAGHGAGQNAADALAAMKKIAAEKPRPPAAKPAEETAAAEPPKNPAMQRAAPEKSAAQSAVDALTAMKKPGDGAK